MPVRYREVKNIPYKGAVIATPPTRKEILHIYDLRVDLEAIDNLTDADFSKLEELHAQMEALPLNHYQLDRQFHHIICAASKLPHLCNIAQALVQSVESVLNIYRREKDHCMRFNAQHRAILDALKSKDPRQVKETFEVNIKSDLEVIKNTYSKLLNVPFE